MGYLFAHNSDMSCSDESVAVIHGINVYAGKSNISARCYRDRDTFTLVQKVIRDIVL